MDCIGIQADGGEQLQNVTGTAEIAGTDLSTHLGGDCLYDLAKPGMGMAAARHDIAQPGQQPPLVIDVAGVTVKTAVFGEVVEGCEVTGAYLVGFAGTAIVRQMGRGFGLIGHFCHRF